MKEIKEVKIYIDAKPHCVVGEAEGQKTIELLRRIYPESMIESLPHKEEWQEFKGKGR